MGLIDTVRAAVFGKRKKYRYSTIPAPNPSRRREPADGIWSRQNRRFLKLTLVCAAFIVVTYLVTSFGRISGYRNGGYGEGSSRLWGQYSPYFAVPSDFGPEIPQGCKITFAQVLSRHGARDPTLSKSQVYNQTIARIQAATTSYSWKYNFLKTYTYDLGADQLTPFGRKQMKDSGSEFYYRYKALAKGDAPPFVRASGQARVVESALNWTQGFYGARIADGGPAGSDSILTIPEKPGENNSLNHNLCTAFETGPYSHVGTDAQAEWGAIWIPPITRRINKNLKGAAVTAAETLYLMDLCPFTSIASTDARPTAFCGLFSADEWRSYDYHQSLGKYYGFNAGNPLGPTQGVGFVNELVARLTGEPVRDATSTNATLDSSPATFPLGRSLYADFGHDNDMTAVFGALGLYNASSAPAAGAQNGAGIGTGTLLPKGRRVEPAAAGGYAAAWTVPFAGRMYLEKMRCGINAANPELVRVLVNGRVVPLKGCYPDEHGRCKLGAFIKSLGFARSGGRWSQCFV